ncbi:uncharacterized protein LOC131885421 [Tigriopus californicus]|uniref:uncharacterized protein LOC131885421 n=1 Tax=Tigriopus californicus TaxID=6832 RepID=UPI0027DA99FB|nr:uncharacterized protein LOC131885421 [Tigriopus californicus]
MAKVLPMEDIEDFEEEDELDMVSKHKLEEAAGKHDRVSLASSSSGDSASATLMSSHAMKMGLYSINLGTKFGQRMHAAHMLILPLIPVFILLAQNGTNYATFILQAEEITNVQDQVSNAVDLSTLAQKLQEERAAVALNIFLKRSPTDDLQSLQNLVTNDVDIRKFTLFQTFNATDTVLQSVTTWPDIVWVDFFETKLKFQIQHSIFRTKIREGEKSIFDVLNWYNEIINFILDYISLSIHDSDVSDFYRYIIGFKNLLRSVEYSGKSGIYALRYFSQGTIERHHHHEFIRFEILRKEYLNQTFNFMPELRVEYEKAAKAQLYEFAQSLVIKLETYPNANDSLVASVGYFSQLLEYAASTQKILDGLTQGIEKFVAKELARFESHKTVPLALLIILALFIPIVAYVTLQATTSMFKFSEIYDEKVETYKREKKKTEKLLTDLLPRQIIHQMKKGKVPEPESFNSVSIFLCDIVGFTSLASESTAHQIVDLLNTLYNLFDIRLENYDVYKVETIGDAYMVASGVPEVNDHHAAEISKMALDLLAKVVTFEVQHKPGYRIKLRMGIHSGSCVAGVVGTKIPHYSVFGETVEIAGLMEATSEPMKIQITESTMVLLEQSGSFNYIQRDQTTIPEKLGNMSTFWLIGRSNAGIDHNNQQNGLTHEKEL